MYGRLVRLCLLAMICTFLYACFDKSPHKPVQSVVPEVAPQRTVYTNTSEPLPAAEIHGNDPDGNHDQPVAAQIARHKAAQVIADLEAMQMDIQKTDVDSAMIKHKAIQDMAYCHMVITINNGMFQPDSKEDIVNFESEYMTQEEAWFATSSGADLVNRVVVLCSEAHKSVDDTLQSAVKPTSQP